MSWNIAFGHGYGSDGSGFKPQTKQDIETSLDRIAALIVSQNADIVLIQEIDFESDRSHRIRQDVYLAGKTGLGYVAKAITWDANYVPFPYWPVSRHFGMVNSGGIILSRFPLSKANTQLLPKPENNGFLYNAFYLFRYHQTASVTVNGNDYVLVNNHLEAFDVANRMDQARSLANTVRSLGDENLLAFGGDFNSLPVLASTKRGFADSKQEDFATDSTLAIIDAVPGYREAISPNQFTAAESDFHTFPAHAPNRRLDYIFIADSVEIIESAVIPTGNLSDHLPVVVKVVLTQPSGE